MIADIIIGLLGVLLMLAMLKYADKFRDLHREIDRRED